MIYNINGYIDKTGVFLSNNKFNFLNYNEGCLKDFDLNYNYLYYSLKEMNFKSFKEMKELLKGSKTFNLIQGRFNNEEYI